MRMQVKLRCDSNLYDEHLVRTAALAAFMGCQTAYLSDAGRASWHGTATFAESFDALVSFVSASCPLDSFPHDWQLLPGPFL